MSRFDGIQYNEQSKGYALEFKKQFDKIEGQINEFLLESRAKGFALKALEEAHMWLGKAIRDQQLKASGDPAIQQERAENY